MMCGRNIQIKANPMMPVPRRQHARLVADCLAADLTLNSDHSSKPQKL